SPPTRAARSSSCRSARAPRSRPARRSRRSRAPPDSTDARGATTRARRPLTESGHVGGVQAKLLARAPALRKLGRLAARVQLLEVRDVLLEQLERLRAVAAGPVAGNDV